MKGSAAKAQTRGKRKVQIGRVASDKMDKTIKVVVERRVAHPVYGKFMTRFTTIVAHDPEEQAGVGDTVEVMETRPVSKTKRWRLLRIVKKVEKV